MINAEKKTIDTTVKILNACFSSFFHMKIVQNQWIEKKKYYNNTKKFAYFDQLGRVNW